MKKPPARLTLRACAKVNLHLDVGPKQRDGYHSLKTLFQQISLYDTLRFQRTEKKTIHLTMTSPFKLPAGPDNLIVKALELLRKRLKTPYGMKVHLTKRIPLGAGLGGGSSNAAAALMAGWRLWARHSRESGNDGFDILLFLAKDLGADVPFFLKGGRAWGKGRGDQLTPVHSSRKRWLVLIYPRVHVSTARAYALLDQARKSKDGLYAKRPSKRFFNSFEPVVFKHYPKVKEAHEALHRLGCKNVMMSGSGSSVFGFVKSRSQGIKIAKRLADRPWDVFLSRT